MGVKAYFTLNLFYFVICSIPEKNTQYPISLDVKWQISHIPVSEMANIPKTPIQASCMMLALMLYFLIVAHMASCHTLSKAFLKSRRHGRDSADAAGISRRGS